LIIILVLLYRCGNSQVQNNICIKHSSIQDQVNQLKSAYSQFVTTKSNAVEYFKIFPCSYDEFISVFGYKESKDTVIFSPLYYESNKYIDLFFKIEIDRQLFYKKLIKVTYKSYWEADAVSEFQSYLMYYFKKESEIILTELMNSSDDEILDFWKFYLFGPHPEKKEKYVNELHTILGDSYPKLSLLLDKAFNSLFNNQTSDL